MVAHAPPFEAVADELLGDPRRADLRGAQRALRLGLPRRLIPADARPGPHRAAALHRAPGAAAVCAMSGRAVSTTSRCTSASRTPARHRAAGDAEVTAQLLERLLSTGARGRGEDTRPTWKQIQLRRGAGGSAGRRAVSGNWRSCPRSPLTAYVSVMPSPTLTGSAAFAATPSRPGSSASTAAPCSASCPSRSGNGGSPADARNRIPLAMRCLLVEHPDGLVLIDTGVGNKEDEKFLDIYGSRTRVAGRDGARGRAGGGGAPARRRGAGDQHPPALRSRRRQHDASPGRGGAVEGAAEPMKTTVSAARLSQRHLLSAARRAGIRPAHQRADAGQLSPAQLRAGRRCRAVPAARGGRESARHPVLTPGHMPYHQVVLVSDGGETAASSPMFPTAAHLPLPWIMGYDLEPLVRWRASAHSQGMPPKGLAGGLRARPEGPGMAGHRGKATRCANRRRTEPWFQAQVLGVRLS